jgi:hypothetical protein
VRRVAAWRAYEALVEADGILSGMIFLRVVIPLQVFDVRVIFSENRFPLFGITR